MFTEDRTPKDIVEDMSELAEEFGHAVNNLIQEGGITQDELGLICMGILLDPAMSSFFIMLDKFADRTGIKEVMKEKNPLYKDEPNG